MNENLIFFSLSKDELKKLVQDSIREELNLKKQKELLSFKETCELLGISASCLNQWKAQSKIPFKKLGKRIFFSRSEILGALKESNYSKLRELNSI